MPGLIQGLEIARRALLAHQSSLNVTANNIANVATPGYTRQSALLSSSPAERLAQGLLGTGVQMDGINRQRNLFLDGQLRQEAALAGRWDARAEILGQVEALFNEPSESGIARLLDDFFDAWLELSNEPEDGTLETVVVEAGRTLAYALRSTDGRLRQILDSTGQQIEQRVEWLNQSFEQLADLNAQIRRSEAAGGIDATLRDRRDLLIDALARESGATHLIRADGTVVLRLGDRTVVEGDRVTRLAVETDRSPVDGDPATAGTLRIVFEGESGGPRDLSGELGGLLETRAQVIPDLLGQLDTLARTLGDRVNQIHGVGPQGLEFFTGEGAGDLEVNSVLVADPLQVQIGSSGDPGDNDIALAIASLRNEQILNRGGASLSDFYRGIVTGVGAQVQQAELVRDGQETALLSLATQRQRENGVNLDEELTQLIQSQKAYEAAARLFTTATEMVDVLLRI